MGWSLLLYGDEEQIIFAVEFERALPGAPVLAG